MPAGRSVHIVAAVAYHARNERLRTHVEDLVRVVLGKHAGYRAEGLLILYAREKQHVLRDMEK